MKLVCVFCISVENQIPGAAKKTIFDIGDDTCNLGHPSIVGVGVMPAMWTDAPDDASLIQLVDPRANP
jgi:hypothetical protein